MGKITHLPAPGTAEWMELAEARRQAAANKAQSEAVKKSLERARKRDW